MTTESPIPAVSVKGKASNRAKVVRVRFRQSFATVAAVCVTAVGGLAVLAESLAYAPVLLAPLAALWWALRTGVDVDADGITIRRALGSQRFAWDDVEGFSSVRGRVSLHLTAAAGGHRRRLPAVTPATLPRLIASVPLAADAPAAISEPAGADSLTEA